MYGTHRILLSNNGARRVSMEWNRVDINYYILSPFESSQSFIRIWIKCSITIIMSLLWYLLWYTVFGKTYSKGNYSYLIDVFVISKEIKWVVNQRNKLEKWRLVEGEGYKRSYPLIWVFYDDKYNRYLDFTAECVYVKCSGYALRSTGKTFFVL